MQKNKDLEVYKSLLTNLCDKKVWQKYVGWYIAYLLKENLRKLKQETEKLEQSEALQKAREKYVNNINTKKN